MHLCRHLAKYRHIVSDPNGRVPKSSIYHKNANIGNNWKYPIYIYQMCDDSVN